MNRTYKIVVSILLCFVVSMTMVSSSVTASIATMNEGLNPVEPTTHIQNMQSIGKVEGPSLKAQWVGEEPEAFQANVSRDIENPGPLGSDDPVVLEGGSPKRITSDSADSNYADVAVDTGDNVHIVWMDDRDGDWEVWYTKLDPFGYTLISPKYLSFYSYDSFYPQVAVGPYTGYIFVVWSQEYGTNDKILLRKSTNGGTSFGSASLVTYHKIDDDKTHLDLKASRPTGTTETLHLIITDWDESITLDEEYEYLEYRRSTNQGGSWSSNTLYWETYDREVGWHYGMLRYPHLAIGLDTSGNVWVWLSFAYDPTPQSMGGTTYIGVGASDDDGVSWGLNEAWVTTRDIGRYNSIAADKAGGCYIAWEDYWDGDFGIKYAWYVPSLDIWYYEPFRDSGQINPYLVVDSENVVHLFWTDDWTGGVFSYWHTYFYLLPNNMPDWNYIRRLVANGVGDKFMLSADIDTSDILQVAWHDNKDSNWEIYHRVYTPEREVTVSDGDCYHPDIAVETGSSLPNVHYVWQDDSNGDWDVFYAKLDTYGELEYGPTLISSGYSSYDSFHPQVAVAPYSGDIYVAWSQEYGVNDKILVRKSTNGGLSFGSAIFVTYHKIDYDKTHLDLKVSNPSGSSETVHLVLTDWDESISLGKEYEYLEYWRSTNGGSSWLSKLLYYEEYNSGASSSHYSMLRYPRMALGDSGSNVLVHVSFAYDSTPVTFGGSTDIYYLKNTNDGQNSYWQSTPTDIGNTLDVGRYNTIAAYNEYVYVAWEDWIGSDFGIEYTRYNPASSPEWSTPIALVDYSGSYQINPCLTTDTSGTVHFFWSDNRRGNYDVYWRLSTNNGAFFGVEFSLVRTPGTTLRTAAVADSNGLLHFVYEDGSSYYNIRHRYY